MVEVIEFMEEEDFERGRLVGGGAYCDGCEEYLEDGEHVYTLVSGAGSAEEFICCQGCRPDDSELPAAVRSLESALAVEDLERDEDAAVYEVREGSECRFCGHPFDAGEWLLVGVVEESYDGRVYCEECYVRMVED